LTNINKQGLIARQGLTADEQKEIRALAEICNAHDGIELKLNYEMLTRRAENETNDYLFYNEAGELIGYLALYGFGGTEVEISGMVHPDHRREGLFRRLYDAAVPEIERRGYTSVLFIVCEESKSGKAFADSLATAYHHSEYLMRMEEPILQAQVHDVQIRRSLVEEIPFLARVMTQAFGLPEEEEARNMSRLIGNDSRRGYTILVGDEPIGRIGLDQADERETFIYGFCVTPEHQGKGYGRQALSQAIELSLAEGRPEVALEVATENRNALRLYESCGFKVIGGYDYYQLKR
jgi:ribosomal protein S18 acetylase RimI-like enzyme